MCSFLTLQFLGVFTKKKKKKILGCDNVGAMPLANPQVHTRRKHMEVDFHFVGVQVAHHALQVCFISTND